MKVQGIVLHESSEKQLDHFVEVPSHAVLLAGAIGTGKTHIAAELALQLLGIKHLENAAYYREVAPVSGSIGIEEIRKLINFFQLKVPGRSAIKRVAVIQDADAMGIPAQNALLKLLEEPPEDSVLILTSSRPQALLQTVRSRVQSLMLASPGLAALQDNFQSSGHSEHAIASAILRHGTNIAEINRQLGGENEGDKSVELVKQVLSGTSYDRLLLVDALSKRKEEAGEFVDTLATVAMASLQAAASKGSDTVARWKNVLQAAHTAQEAFDKNGNSKIVLTELMLAI